MFIFHLITTLVVGIAVAGILMLVNKLLRKVLPFYVFPIAVGASMLLYNVWHEYSWHDRMDSQFSEQVVTLKTSAQPSVFQPWTYLFPRVDRMLAMDTSQILRNPKNSQLAIVEFLELGRLQSTLRRRVLYDCENNRASDVLDNAEFDDSGLPKKLSWYRLVLGKSAQKVICKSGATTTQPG